MKKLLFGFILGLIAGVWGYSIFHKSPARGNAGSNRGAVSQEAGRIFRDIRVEEVRQELDRTGLVIRQKAAQVGAFLSGRAGSLHPGRIDRMCVTNDSSGEHQ